MSCHDQMLEGSGVIDFDNNGKMDTDTLAFRVLITDMQVRATGAINKLIHVHLLDDTGIRWELTPTPAPVSYSLSSPLALPINSKLRIEVKTGPYTGGSTQSPLSVNLIGRLVSM